MQFSSKLMGFTDLPDIRGRGSSVSSPGALRQPREANDDRLNARRSREAEEEPGGNTKSMEANTDMVCSRAPTTCAYRRIP